MLFRKALRRDLLNLAGIVFSTLFVIMVTTSLIRLLGRAAGGRVGRPPVRRRGGPREGPGGVGRRISRSAGAAWPASAIRSTQREVVERMPSAACFFASLAAFFSFGVDCGFFFVSLLLCLNLPMAVLPKITGGCAVPPQYRPADRGDER